MGAFDDLIPKQQGATPQSGGAFADLIPQQPAAPDPGREASLGERFMVNAGQGFEGTLAGQATTNWMNEGNRYGAQAGTVQDILRVMADQGLEQAPQTLPNPAQGGTPSPEGPDYLGAGVETTMPGLGTGDLAGMSEPELRERLAFLQEQQAQGQAEFEEERAPVLARREGMPSWYEEDGVTGKGAAGIAALLGQLAGGAPSPENLLAFGRGANVAGRFGRGAAGGAAGAGVAEPVVQEQEVRRGEREDTSVAEGAFNVALGGVLGGVLNVTPDMARGVKRLIAGRLNKPEAEVTPDDLQQFDPDELMATAQAASDAATLDPEALESAIRTGTGQDANPRVGEGMAPKDAKRARRDVERELGGLFGYVDSKGQDVPGTTDVYRRDDLAPGEEGPTLREGAEPLRDPSGEQANAESYGARSAAARTARELGVTLDDNALRLAARDIQADPSVDPADVVRSYSQEDRGRSFDRADIQRRRGEDYQRDRQGRVEAFENQPDQVQQRVRREYANRGIDPDGVANAFNRARVSGDMREVGDLREDQAANSRREYSRSAFDIAESRRARREDDLATGENIDSQASTYRAAEEPYERQGQREVAILDPVRDNRPKDRSGKTSRGDGRLTGGESVQVLDRETQPDGKGGLVDMVKIVRGDNDPEWVVASRIETVQTPENPRMFGEARAQTREPPRGVGRERGDSPEGYEASQTPQPRRAVDRQADPDGLRRGLYQEGEPDPAPGDAAPGARAEETYDGNTGRPYREAETTEMSPQGEVRTDFQGEGGTTPVTRTRRPVQERQSFSEFQRQQERETGLNLDDAETMTDAEMEAMFAKADGPEAQPRDETAQPDAPASESEAAPVNANAPDGLTDPEAAQALRDSKQQYGWVERGGNLLRDAEGRPKGRTRWLPANQALMDALKNKKVTEDGYKKLVDRALDPDAKPLTNRQRNILEEVLEAIDPRSMERAETEAEADMEAQFGRSDDEPEAPDESIPAKGPMEAPAEDFISAYREFAQDGDPRSPFVSPEQVTRAADKAANQPELSPEQAQARLQEWKDHARRQGESGVNSDRVVLSLFDVSGEWSKPWRDAGYDVRTFDIKTGQDIREFSPDFLADELGIPSQVHVVLAAPPCTDFSGAGSRTWPAKDADGRTEASVELIRQTLSTVDYFKPGVWAMENPVGRLRGMLGEDPNLIFQPHHYGDPYTKRTLLWGDFDPDMPQANVNPSEGSRTANLSGTDQYGRSVTPEGFAHAFFMQNNLEDMAPGERVTRQYRGLDRGLVDAALKSGVDEATLEQRIADDWNDGNVDGANDTLREMTDDFDLEAQTEASRAEGERTTREREDTERRKRLNEEQRAQADRDADDFVLSGSDRYADQAASRGQMDLTDQAAQPRDAKAQAGTADMAEATAFGTRALSPGEAAYVARKLGMDNVRRGDRKQILDRAREAGLLTKDNRLDVANLSREQRRTLSREVADLEAEQGQWASLASEMNQALRNAEAAQRRGNMRDVNAGSPGGTQLYSGIPLDRIAAGVKKAWAGERKGARETAERTGMLMESSKEALGGSRAKNRATKRSPLMDLWRVTLASLDGDLRTLAGKFNSPTLKGLPDLFHATAGRGDAVGQTFDEAVQARNNPRLQEVDRFMSRLRDANLSSTEKQQQVIRLIENPKAARRGEAGKVANDIEKFLKKELEYLRKAGVDVGEVRDGYFPREMDGGKARANADGFIRAATRAYKEMGLRDADAKASAEAYWESTVYGASGKPGVRPNSGQTPSFVQSRVFNKAAAKHLDAYRVRDIDSVLSQYVMRATRRAEIARRFGDNWKDWGEIEAKIRQEDPDAQEILPMVRDRVALSAGVNLHSLGSAAQHSLSMARTWTTLATLPKAAMSSIGELVIAPWRGTTGNVPGDMGQHLFNIWAHIGNISSTMAGLGRSEQLQASFELAEDIGIIAGTGHNSLMAARFAGGDPVGRVQSEVLAQFFRRNLLEGLTNYTRVTSMVQGQVFLRRLGKQMERHPARTGVFLRELGVPRGEEAAFAKYLRGMGDDLPMASTATGRYAGVYRNALQRFTDQTVMRPSQSTRPKYASHPLGAVIFQLQAFGYAFQKNVLNRQFRLLASKDLSTADKLAYSVSAATSAALLVGLQGLMRDTRDRLYDPEIRERKTPMAHLEGAVSQAGLLGVADPYLQSLTGIRYQRNPLASLMGPAASGLAESTFTATSLLLNNSENTNTSERNLADSMYDWLIEPTMQAALTPVSTGTPIIGKLATAATVYGIPKGRDYFTDALAGPRTDRKKPPIQGTLEWIVNGPAGASGSGRGSGRSSGRDGGRDGGR